MGYYTIFLGPNLIAWSARKQKIIARSSTKAEYRSLALATKEVMWLQSLFSELGLPKMSKVLIIWCDNTRAKSMASHDTFHARTKHVKIDVLFVRDRIEAKELEVKYVPTEEQIANIFTKPLTTTRFEFFRSKLTVEESPLT